MWKGRENYECNTSFYSWHVYRTLRRISFVPRGNVRMKILCVVNLKRQTINYAVGDKERDWNCIGFEQWRAESRALRIVARYEGYTPEVWILFFENRSRLYIKDTHWGGKRYVHVSQFSQTPPPPTCPPNIVGHYAITR